METIKLLQSKKSNKYFFRISIEGIGLSKQTIQTLDRINSSWKEIELHFYGFEKLFTTFIYDENSNEQHMQIDCLVSLCVSMYIYGEVIRKLITESLYKNLSTELSTQIDTIHEENSLLWKNIRTLRNELRLHPDKPFHRESIAYIAGTDPEVRFFFNFVYEDKNNIERKILFRPFFDLKIIEIELQKIADLLDRNDN